MIRGGRLVALVLAASGCALEPGEGFARLEPGALHASLEIGPARELAEHQLLTDQGYRVELASCSLAVEGFELQSLEAGSGGNRNARFDPADPPDGYASCHGGHCHADDGSLVPYDEVQARLAGGEASWKPVARVALAGKLDLLAGSRRTLSRYEPGADLPEGSIGRAALQVSGLRCGGTVEGDALPEPVALEVDLPLTAASFQVPLDHHVSRDGPDSLAPEVRLRVDGTLFDRLDFAALAEDGRVSLGEDATAFESFVGAASLTVQLRSGKD